MSFYWPFGPSGESDLAVFIVDTGQFMRAPSVTAVQWGTSHRANACRVPSTTNRSVLPRFPFFFFFSIAGSFFSLFLFFFLNMFYFFTVLHTITRCFPRAREQCDNGRNPLNRGHVRRANCTCKFSVAFRRLVMKNVFDDVCLEKKRKEIPMFENRHGIRKIAIVRRTFFPTLVQ